MTTKTTNSKKAPARQKVRKTVDLAKLLRRLKTARDTNVALAQQCRDEGQPKAASEYAEGSAFAFYRAAEIASQLAK